MNTEHTDQRIHAFVDDELTHGEVENLYREMRDDPALRAEAAEIQGLKRLIRRAYDEDAPEAMAPASYSYCTWRTAASAAALLFCALIGWAAHALYTPIDAPTLAMAPAASIGDRVLLHVDKADPASWDAALNTAEQLLRADTGRNTHVELLTNAGGIDLLRRDTSPFAPRIEAMARRYPNLAFVACASAIQHLADEGVDVKLLQPAQTTPSALDRVVERLTSGWRYQKI